MSMSETQRRELMTLRRQLIGTLKSIEDALDLPPGQRACSVRAARRSQQSLDSRTAVRVKSKQ